MKSGYPYFYLFTFFIASPCYSTTTQELLNLMKPEIYQDVIINGIVVKEGVKNCDTRLPYIEDLIRNYERPLTMLDIGASQGYYEMVLAAKYPSLQCVMVEGDPKNLLPEICKANSSLNNVTVLQKRISVEELEELGSCEHFDIILALNVIHHFKDKWQRAIDAILKLGDLILIETPPLGCHTAANGSIIPLIIDYLNNHPSGRIIGKVPRYGRLGLPGDDQKYADLYLFQMYKNVLPKSTWGSEHLRYYAITSNYQEKTFFKPRINKTITWKPGINLWTFKHLNGKYPTLETIKDEIVRLSKIPHGDFVPWNIIVQGSSLELIDWEENNFIEGTSNPDLCFQIFQR